MRFASERIEGDGPARDCTKRNVSELRTVLLDPERRTAIAGVSGGAGGGGGAGPIATYDRYFQLVKKVHDGVLRDFGQANAMYATGHPLSGDAKIGGGGTVGRGRGQ